MENSVEFRLAIFEPVSFIYDDIVEMKFIKIVFIFDDILIGGYNDIEIEIRDLLLNGLPLQFSALVEYFSESGGEPIEL